MEDLEDVLTLMTTNFPEKMERALIDRPGRFDKELRFANPDKGLALLMVKRFTMKYQLKDYTNTHWDSIGEMLAGLSGAHVYDAVKRAVIRAIDDPRLTQGGRLMLPIPYLVDCALDVHNEHKAKQDRFLEGLEDIPDTPQLAPPPPPPPQPEPTPAAEQK